MTLMPQQLQLADSLLLELVSRRSLAALAVVVATAGDLLRSSSPTSPRLTSTTHSVGQYISDVQQILETAADEGVGVYFAAQFAKGADDEVKIETSLDHVTKYRLVQRLLQRMGLSRSNLHSPFAILT